MRRLLPFLVFLFSGLGIALYAADTKSADWHVNATAIEACSCPMFCQCYFNTKPAGHHEEGGKHFCRATLAYKVNKGHWGTVNLDGAKFWVANDLGGDFTTGVFDWYVLYFDKSLSKEQRTAIEAFYAKLFPVKWKSAKTAEGVIDKWEITDTWAHATLDGGKTGEIKLVRPATALAAGPVVIKNLKYWGAARNDGFVLMPNEIEAYRVGPNAFEYKGSNGFLITVDMSSKDFEGKPAAGGQ